MTSRDLTAKEIESRLNKMAARWPKHLTLFSWSGSLVLIDERKVIDWGKGVPASACTPIDRGLVNGGGDPHEIQDKADYE